jgi:hypothetical protein
LAIKEVQLWILWTKPWFAVIAGSSSFLPSASRNSISLMAYRVNLVAVQSAGLLGEESAGVAITGKDRCILRYVLAAGQKQRYLLSPRKGDRSIAKSATLSKKGQVKFLNLSLLPTIYHECRGLSG